MTSLPPIIISGHPKFHLNVHTRKLILRQEDIKVTKQLSLRLRWWGEPESSPGVLFRPPITVLKANKQVQVFNIKPSLESRHSFPVLCSLSAFSRYLLDMGLFEFDLLEAGTIIGRVSISELDMVTQSPLRPFEGSFPVYLVGARRMKQCGELHLSISLVPHKAFPGQLGNAGAQVTDSNTALQGTTSQLNLADKIPETPPTVLSERSLNINRPETVLPMENKSNELVKEWWVRALALKQKIHAALNESETQPSPNQSLEPSYVSSAESSNDLEGVTELLESDIARELAKQYDTLLQPEMKQDQQKNDEKQRLQAIAAFRFKFTRMNLFQLAVTNQLRDCTAVLIKIQPTEIVKEYSTRQDIRIGTQIELKSQLEVPLEIHEQPSEEAKMKVWVEFKKSRYATSVIFRASFELRLVDILNHDVQDTVAQLRDQDNKLMGDVHLKSSLLWHNPNPNHATSSYPYVKISVPSMQLSYDFVSGSRVHLELKLAAVSNRIELRSKVVRVEDLGTAPLEFVYSGPIIVSKETLPHLREVVLEVWDQTDLVGIAKVPTEGLFESYLMAETHASSIPLLDYSIYDVITNSYKGTIKYEMAVGPLNMISREQATLIDKPATAEPSISAHIKLNQLSGLKTACMKADLIDVDSQPVTYSVKPHLPKFALDGSASEPIQAQSSQFCPLLAKDWTLNLKPNAEALRWIVHDGVLTCDVVAETSTRREIIGKFDLPAGRVLKNDAEISDAWVPVYSPANKQEIVGHVQYGCASERKNVKRRPPSQQPTKVKLDVQKVRGLKVEQGVEKVPCRWKMESWKKWRESEFTVNDGQLSLSDEVEARSPTEGLVQLEILDKHGDVQYALTLDPEKDAGKPLTVIDPRSAQVCPAVAEVEVTKRPPRDETKADLRPPVVASIPHTMKPIHITIEKALRVPKVLSGTGKSAQHADTHQQVPPNLYARLTWIPRSGFGEEHYATPVTSNSCSPVFNHKICVEHSTDPRDLDALRQRGLVIQLFHHVNAKTKDVLVAETRVDLDPLFCGLPCVNGWYELLDQHGRPAGEIKICIEPFEWLFTGTPSRLNPIPSNETTGKPKKGVDLGKSLAELMRMRETLRGQLRQADERMDSLRQSMGVGSRASSVSPVKMMDTPSQQQQRQQQVRIEEPPESQQQQQDASTYSFNYSMYKYDDADPGEDGVGHDQERELKLEDLQPPDADTTDDVLIEDLEITPRPRKDSVPPPSPFDLPPVADDAEDPATMSLAKKPDLSPLLEFAESGGSVLDELGKGGTKLCGSRTDSVVAMNPLGFKFAERVVVSGVSGDDDEGSGQDEVKASESRDDNFEDAPS